MRRREGKRKRAFLIWGLCPQTPEIYRFGARMTRGTIGALERRIGLRQRCDPSADSRAGMAGGGFGRPEQQLGNPSDLNLLRAKNGPNFGGHLQESTTDMNITSRSSP